MHLQLKEAQLRQVLQQAQFWLSRVFKLRHVHIIIILQVISLNVLGQYYVDQEWLPREDQHHHWGRLEQVSGEVVSLLL